MSEVDAEQILNRYSGGNVIPRLTHEELSVVSPYVRERLANVAGVLPLKNGTDETTLAEIRNYEVRMERENNNKIVVGPYILGDYYYPSGVGIYLAKK